MPPVGSSSSSTLASVASRHASSTTRRVPVERSALNVSAYGPRREVVQDLVGLGSLPPLPGLAGRQAEQRLHQHASAGGPRGRPGPSPARSASRTAPRPGTPDPGRRHGARGRTCARCPSRAARSSPTWGTKPEIAFIRVDLPAPLVPMRPTSSPLADLDRDPLDRVHATEADAHLACRPARGPRRPGRCDAPLVDRRWRARRAPARPRLASWRGPSAPGPGPRRGPGPARRGSRAAGSAARRWPTAVGRCRWRRTPPGCRPPRAAPRIGPATVPMPPMMAMATSWSDASGENGLSAPVATKPGSRKT